MITPEQGREMVRKAAKELGYSAEEAEAYIKEAEHGEGDAYWDYFATEEDIKQDVYIYYINLI